MRNPQTAERLPLPTGMRMFLRHETRALHDRVEARFDLDGRVRSREGYIGALLALHDLHDAAATALAAVDRQGESVDTARMATRRGWLADDLRVLGHPAPPSSQQRLDLDGPAEVRGCLYVLEGSMLGGRVIARAVATGLGIGPDNGGRYFSGFGAATGKAWSEFLDVLDARPVESEGAATLAGARKTFELFTAAAAVLPQA